MDTKKYQRRAKAAYVRSLRHIATCKNLAKKVEPLLPKGWKFSVDTTFHIIRIEKFDLEEKGTDSHEFKLVCKLLEKALGEKLENRHGTATKKEIVTSLQASGCYRMDRRYVSVYICLMNPENMPDCEITWKRKWTKEAILSDACLGLNPEVG